jgi:heavy metal translocating P-type ATPase
MAQTVDAKHRETHRHAASSAGSVLRKFRLLSVVVLASVTTGALALFGADQPARWLVIIVAGAVGIHVAVGMIRDLIHGHAGVDLLAVTAIAATLAVQEYAAAMVIVLMLTGGRSLEQYANNRAQRELTALLAGAPRVAHLWNGSASEDVPVENVAVGDCLLVKPAEVLPVDGILTTAAATFDESSLTGESMPVERVAGDPVLSGAVNGAVAITMTATATAAESQYTQIIALVSEATNSRSRVVRLADRYAVPFTAFAYLVAALAWVASGSATRFAAVLVVATPCPLLIAAPVAYLGGMSRAARRGIILKSAAALEVASRIRTAAFDKTGTLTLGRPALLSVDAADWIGEERLLSMAAAAEQLSSHVLAQSVIRAATERGLAIPEVTEGREWATHGVRASVGGHWVRVGKPAFVAEAGVAIPDRDIVGGEVAVYVAVDDRYAGILRLADRPRPEARDTVRRLRDMGIRHTLMVTGDAEPTAQAIAREVGVVDVRAECLPADKVAIVRNEPQRPIMMVGDGVNDAPVLAAADVGVAMGARGATAAAQSADVVILRDTLELVADTVSIGQRTVSVALQSIWLGIGLSVGLMIVAAFGVLPPVFGAVSQEAVDLAAIGNALRAVSSGRRE